MDIKNILKISGIVVVPFVIMLIAAFFLYPYLNDDKYEEVVNNFDPETEAFNEPPLPGEMRADSLNEALSDSTFAQIDSTQTESEIIFSAEKESRLNGIIDSLHIEIAKLEKKIKSLNNANKDLVQEATLAPEEFAERIKSLLNLEEKDLAPILDKMTTKQLVNLYFGGGTIQREKILRSLNADKAAELMTEIML